MSGFRSYGRPPSRRTPSPFDDDDDGEAFETDPPRVLAGLPSSAAAGRGSESSDGASLSFEGSERPQRSGHFERSDRRERPERADKPKRSLKGRALGYLSRREHSRSELARKLAPFVEESDGEQAVERLLDALGNEGWLSDSRFAESVVNRRAARFGTSRIVGELKRHGIDSDLVASVSADLKESEWDRIRLVWGKKFGNVAATPAERAKQARFLAARGFSRDAIMRVLRVGDDELPGDD